MELYFARRGPQRAYIVAPNRQRAQELADRFLGVPSTRASISRIDDDVIIDTTDIEGASSSSIRSKQ